MDAPKKERGLARRIFKSFAVLALLGILGIATLLGALWLERRTAVTLPTPTGPFAVGRAVYDWTDDTGVDPLAPVAGTKRELLVWMWYPAAGLAATGEYLPATARDAMESSSSPLIKFLTHDLAKVRAHSIANSEVSPQQQTYPVVIMRAGASLEVWNYSTLAEDLASHGYVVVGFDAPYRTFVVGFPDGRVMRRLPENNPELCEGQEPAQRDRCVSRVLSAWTADMAFVLDRLKQLNASDVTGKFAGRLDMTRVGVFGHSFGGAQAAQFCSQDSRCRAGIDVDGQLFDSVIQTGIHRPFMILVSDQGGESDAESRRIMADLQSVYDRLPPEGRAFLQIRGANHFLFGDDVALLKSHMVMRALRGAGIVRIDGRRQLEVTAHCIHSFFDAYLKGTGDLRPKLATSLYPEITVLQ